MTKQASESERMRESKKESVTKSFDSGYDVGAQDGSDSGWFFPSSLMQQRGPVF